MIVEAALAFLIGHKSKFKFVVIINIKAAVLRVLVLLTKHFYLFVFKVLSILCIVITGAC